MKLLIILSTLAVGFVSIQGVNNYEYMKKLQSYGNPKPIIQECKYPTVYKDSNGFYVSIKEHYGNIERDSGTMLLQNDNEYCLVKRNQPARIIPKSRWTCTIEDTIK